MDSSLAVDVDTGKYCFYFISIAFLFLAFAQSLAVFIFRYCLHSSCGTWFNDTPFDSSAEQYIFLWVYTKDLKWLKNERPFKCISLPSFRQCNFSESPL